METTPGTYLQVVSLLRETMGTAMSQFHGVEVSTQSLHRITHDKADLRIPQMVRTSLILIVIVLPEILTPFQEGHQIPCIAEDPGGGLQKDQ